MSSNEVVWSPWVMEQRNWLYGERSGCSARQCRAHSHDVSVPVPAGDAGKRRAGPVRTHGNDLLGDLTIARADTVAGNPGASLTCQRLACAACCCPLPRPKNPVGGRMPCNRSCSTVVQSCSARGSCRGTMPLPLMFSSRNPLMARDKAATMASLSLSSAGDGPAETASRSRRKASMTFGKLTVPLPWAWTGVLQDARPCARHTDKRASQRVSAHKWREHETGVYSSGGSTSLRMLVALGWRWDGATLTQHDLLLTCVARSARHCWGRS